MCIALESLYDEKGTITFGDVEKLVQGKSATPEAVKNVLAELKVRDITPVESVQKKFQKALMTWFFLHLMNLELEMT